MKKVYAATIAGLSLMLLLLCGAGSKESVKVIGDSLIPLNRSELGIAVSAQYMSEEDRIALVGVNSNPFLHYGNVPLMVFRVSVQGNPQEIRLFYNSFALRYANGVQQPLQKNYITTYWENKLRRYSGNKTLQDWTSNKKRYARWHPGKTRYNANMYMVNTTQPIEEGEQYEGLVVFEGAPPRNGSLIFVAPVYSDKGRLLHAFEFEYVPQLGQ